ncbi:MAG: OprD family outer membrane porin [Sulfurospirillaceae bacterium]|nr:OprD family outer membrane porin [Sulfurospirillaceae bacterium]
MKRLSVATLVVAGLFSSQAFAVDTLADAFKNGTLKGELKAFYFDRDNGTSSADITTFGVLLGYKTASFYGLSMGTTFQGSSSPFVDSAGKTMFKNDEWGSGGVLSEAYIAYKMDKTEVKAGRMFFNTPLIANSPARVIVQSFEGATITNTNLPQTTLLAGVFSKFQDRTDGTGGMGTFEALDNDHNKAYTLYAKNNSIKGLGLVGQFVTISSDSSNLGINLYYGEADYKSKLGSVGYNFAGQYLYADWDNFDSTDMIGFKIGGNFAGFSSYVAYSSISKNDNGKGVGRNDKYAGFGNLTQPIFTKAYGPYVGTYTHDTDAYAVDVNYDFKNLNLLTGARYSVTQRDSIASGTGVNTRSSYDVSYTDFYAKYRFSGALKGMCLDVCYLDVGKDGVGSELWVKAIYKF